MIYIETTIDQSPNIMHLRTKKSWYGLHQWAKPIMNSQSYNSSAWYNTAFNKKNQNKTNKNYL